MRAKDLLRPIQNRAARLACRLSSVLAACCIASLAQAQNGPVGAVTLKLGEAWIIAADGSRRPAAPEAPVSVGEALETAPSGHLHLRFVDGGLVSVRPGSRLVIENYRDPAAGGAVRMRLERGQARSITGRYGETNRARFRLNTPIAALGIAGTDFVVTAEPELTRVAVNSGAVIAAPFGEACRPDDLGPCGGPHARRLAAEMGALMLEIRPDAAPVLVPRNGLAAADGARRAIEAAAPKSETLTQALVEKALPPASPPATLVWGRWAHAPAWEGDVLALPREQAAAGRERIAENSRYVLYRLPQTDPLPTQGSVELALSAAQAHLVQVDGVLPAQVRDGRLTLDFAARRFSTTLSLDSAATGQVPFAAAGAIQPDGSFSLIEWLSRVKGAWGGVSAGGAGPAASYLFERATPQGLFMGITQWR